jgi:Protein of unknown function (DUF1761)
MISIISWSGVLAAATAYWVLGVLWYSALFGTYWLRLTKVKPNSEAMVSVMIKGFILSVIAAAGLMCIQYRLGLSEPLRGLLLGLTAWVGLVFPVRAQAVVYENYPIKLFILNGAYNLIGFMLMGFILSYFI